MRKIQLTKLNKKGIFFTIIAILLVSVMVSSTFFLTKSNYNKRSFVANSRVSSMNDFISSIEQDMERSMLISGYRSIISLQKHVAANATFISNFDSTFSEVFINGTVNGISEDLMIDSSINDWIDRINTESLKVNIIFNFYPTSVMVYHDTPWSVVVELNGYMNISDTNNLASWYFNKTFKKGFDIISFEDPLYTVKSSDKVTNIIVKANYSTFINPLNNDTSVLAYHVNNSIYIASINAPSFLMRFVGNLSPSPFGIESFVDLQDFSNQDIDLKDKSIIDYEYFNDDYNGTDKCNFVNMTSWFRIDNTRLIDYNLTGFGVDC